MTASTQPKNRTLGSSDLSVLPIGLGCMSLSGAYGKSNDDEAIRVIHHAIDRGVNFLDSSDMYGWGHNETLLGKALAGGRRGQGGAGHQVRPDAAAGRRQRRRRQPRPCEGRLRREPEAARRRRDRSLLPASRRSLGADRGHGRRHGRAGEGGQGARARPQRGQAGDHPARPQGPSSRRGAERVLAALSRACRGDAQDHARARHLLRRLLAARPQPADRHGATGVRHSRRRRPRPPSALCRRQPGTQSRQGRRHRGASRARRAASRARWRSPGCWRKAPTSCRSPAPSAPSGSTRTWRRSASRCRPTRSPDCRRRCRPARPRARAIPKAA